MIFTDGDLRTSYYRYPDGEDYFVYVWLKGSDVADSYVIRTESARKYYPNCSSCEGVQKIARERFTSKFLEETKESTR